MSETAGSWTLRCLADTVARLVQEYDVFQTDVRVKQTRATGLPRDIAEDDTHDPYSYATGRRHLRSRIVTPEPTKGDSIGRKLVDLHDSILHMRPYADLSTGESMNGAVACRICLAGFRCGDVLTRLPCDHLFHW